jgi:hypothetical protein
MELSARRSNERSDTFIVRTPRSNATLEHGVPEANVTTIIMPDGKAVHALDRAVFNRAVKRAFNK